MALRALISWFAMIGFFTRTALQSWALEASALVVGMSLSFLICTSTIGGQVLTVPPLHRCAIKTREVTKSLIARYLSTGTVNDMTSLWNCPDLKQLFTSALEAADEQDSDASKETTHWVRFGSIDDPSDD